MNPGYLEEDGYRTNAQLCADADRCQHPKCLKPTNTHAEAAPKPLDNSLLNTPMPPPLHQDHVFVLDQTRVLALDKHFLRLLSSEERDLLGELSEARVCMPEIARKLSGLGGKCSERRSQSAYWGNGVVREVIRLAKSDTTYEA